jgi:hypothetical protein
MDEIAQTEDASKAAEREEATAALRRALRALEAALGKLNALSWTDKAAAEAADYLGRALDGVDDAMIAIGA